jgi:NAD-specific glutamate dehydrogenase
MLARQSNLIDKLKDENRNYCKEMLNNTKQKKQMIEVKKNMAESQSEIQSIKDKIEKEISSQKQLDLEMIDV